MNSSIFFCPQCGKEFTIDSHRWRCDCGKYLNLKQSPATFSKTTIQKGPFSLWRYKMALPTIHPSSIISLGEGCTPLVSGHWNDSKVSFKLEFVSPTGSFKDRGAAMMISKVKELGIDHVLDDSSGNAGASISAYCSKAGIRCDIYCPSGHSPGKLRQVQSYGANLIPVNGTREETELAAQDAAQTVYYASHQMNPFFIEGMKSFAFEIWEQMGWDVPDAVVAVIGSGGLLLGAYMGFKQLLMNGLISRMPRIYGVQAEACAPVHKAFVMGGNKIKRVEQKPTIAEGISIVNPVRGEDVLAVVRETGGTVEVVSDEEIRSALRDLAAQGLYVEPTSAAAPAALEKLFSQGHLSLEERIVVPLTGSGLKYSS